MEQEKQLLARFTGVYRRGFLSERYEVLVNLFPGNVEGEGFIFKNNDISESMVRYRIMLKDVVTARCMVFNGIRALQIIFEHRMNGQSLRETLLLPGLLGADKAAADIIHAQGVWMQQQREPLEEKQTDSDEFLQDLINNTAFNQEQAPPLETGGDQIELNMGFEYEKSQEIKLEPIVLNLGIENPAATIEKPAQIVLECKEAAITQNISEDIPGGVNDKTPEPKAEDAPQEKIVREAAASLTTFKIKVEKLKMMRDNQLLTDEEFEEEKKKLLSDI